MSSAPAMRGNFSLHYQNRGKIQPPFSKISGSYIQAPKRLASNSYPRNILTSPSTVNRAFPSARLLTRTYARRVQLRSHPSFKTEQF